MPGLPLIHRERGARILPLPEVQRRKRETTLAAPRGHDAGKHHQAHARERAELARCCFLRLLSRNKTERRGNRQKVTTGRCRWKKTPPQPSLHEAHNANPSIPVKQVRWRSAISSVHQYTGSRRRRRFALVMEAQHAPVMTAMRFVGISSMVPGAYCSAGHKRVMYKVEQVNISSTTSKDNAGTKKSQSTKRRSPSQYTPS
ncbi:unnamed protein product [Trichogramma brassicae]|uniref:Uncharacterized protein n=1 Tax=Trichogramma brassicae TaxID=86971 RepID=A0A6H5IYS4_9HYME|nr:unnamed protein product [Trichogramma brassicae]